jgi:hypothetical protein
LQYWPFFPQLSSICTHQGSGVKTTFTCMEPRKLVTKVPIQSGSSSCLTVCRYFVQLNSWSISPKNLNDFANYSFSTHHYPLFPTPMFLFLIALDSRGYLLPPNSSLTISEANMRMLKRNTLLQNKFK